MSYLSYLTVFYDYAAWLESVGSRVLYELDPKKPVLYVIPVESILGKLPVVPVGDFGSVPNGIAHNAPTRLPTARQAQETAVPCGMSTHGRWAGPARRSLLFCPSEHTDTWQVRAPTPPRRRRPRADAAGQDRAPTPKPFTKPTEERDATSLRPHWKWQ